MPRYKADLPGPGAILTEGLRFTCRHGGLLVTSGGIYAALAAAVWIADDLWRLPEAVPGLATVYCFAAFSYRAYLMGPEALPGKPSRTKGGDRETSRALFKFQNRFACHAIGLSLALGVVVTAIALPFVLKAQMSEAVILTLFGAVAVPVCLVLIFPLSRLFPAFAALAVERRLGWGAAWKLSRGAGWRLAVALIPVGLSWMVIVVALGEALPATGLPPPNDRLAFDIAAAVVSVPLVAVGSACNACVFKALTNRTTPDASAAEAFD